MNNLLSLADGATFSIQRDDPNHPVEEAELNWELLVAYVQNACTDAEDRVIARQIASFGRWRNAYISIVAEVAPSAIHAPADAASPPASTYSDRSDFLTLEESESSGLASSIGAIPWTVSIDRVFIDAIAESVDAEYTARLFKAQRGILRCTFDTWRARLSSSKSGMIRVRLSTLAPVVESFLTDGRSYSELGLDRETATAVSRFLRLRDNRNRQAYFRPPRHLAERIDEFTDTSGEHILRYALDAIAEWADGTLAESISPVDHSSKHTHRMLELAMPFFCFPLVKSDLTPFLSFLAAAVITFHDLGYCLPLSGLYPEANEDDLSDRQRRGRHELHHLLLARHLDRIAQGEFPPIVSKRLEEIGCENRELAEKVAQMLRAVAPFLSFLARNHNNHRGRLDIGHDAVVSQLSMPTLDITVSPPDLLYLLAVIRLADHLDRTRSRLTSKKNMESLAAKLERDGRLGGGEAWELIHSLETWATESTRLDIIEADKQIQVSCSILWPYDGAPAEHPLGEYILERVNQMYNVEHNELLGVIEDYTGYLFKEPKIELKRTSKDIRVRSAYAKTLTRLGKSRPGNSVTQALSNALMVCSGRNTWLKYFDRRWGVLYGGDAHVEGNRRAVATHRSMVFPPGIFDFKTPFDLEIVENCRDTLRRYLNRTGNLDPMRKRLFLSYFQATKEAAAEVYVPIVVRGAVLALANVHFHDEDLPRRNRRPWLEQYAAELQRDLQPHGPEIARAMFSELRTAQEVLETRRKSKHLDSGAALSAQTAVSASLNDNRLGLEIDVRELLAASLEASPDLRRRVMVRCLRREKPAAVAKHAYGAKMIYPDGIVTVVTQLLRELTSDGRCDVEVGIAGGMPLVHLVFWPDSLRFQYLLQNVKLRECFDTPSLLPFEDGKENDLSSLFELRLLTMLSCGRLQFVRRQFPSSVQNVAPCNSQIGMAFMFPSAVLWSSRA